MASGSRIGAGVVVVVVDGVVTIGGWFTRLGTENAGGRAGDRLFWLLVLDGRKRFDDGWLLMAGMRSRALPLRVFVVVVLARVRATTRGFCGLLNESENEVCKGESDFGVSTFGTLALGAGRGRSGCTGL